MSFRRVAIPALRGSVSYARRHRRASGPPVAISLMIGHGTRASHSPAMNLRGYSQGYRTLTSLHAPTCVLNAGIGRGPHYISCCPFASGTTTTTTDHLGALFTQASTLLQQGDDHTVDLMLGGMVGVLEKEASSGVTGARAGLAWVAAVRASTAADAGYANAALTHATQALQALERLEYSDMDKDTRGSLYTALRIASVSSLRHQNKPLHVDNLPPVAREYVEAVCEMVRAEGTRGVETPIPGYNDDPHLHSEILILNALSAVTVRDKQAAATCANRLSSVIAEPAPIAPPASAHEWWQACMTARALSAHARVTLLTGEYDDAMNSANKATQYRELLTTPTSPELAGTLALAGDAYGALSRTSGLAEHFMYSQGLFNTALKVLRKYPSSPILANALERYAVVLDVEARHASAAAQVRAEAARIPTPDRDVRVLSLLSTGLSL